MVHRTALLVTAGGALGSVIGGGIGYTASIIAQTTLIGSMFALGCSSAFLPICIPLLCVLPRASVQRIDELAAHILFAQEDIMKSVRNIVIICPLIGVATGGVAGAAIGYIASKVSEYIFPKKDKEA